MHVQNSLNKCESLLRLIRLSQPRWKDRVVWWVFAYEIRPKVDPTTFSINLTKSQLLRNITQKQSRPSPISKHSAIQHVSVNLKIRMRKTAVKPG